MKNIILNPIYGIRNDETCSFIYVIDDSFETLIKKLPDALEIPPLYGYILSYFQNPCSIEETIKKISEYTSIKANSISIFIQKIINNKTSLGIKYGNKFITLPPDLLISDNDNIKERARIKTNNKFNCFNAFSKSRPTCPAKVTIMLTTRCKTDCIYCYADRSQKTDFKLDEILPLIDDCYSSGVLKVNLSGGDIFAYKEWKSVIKKMNTYNYVPFLSTKIPLSTEEILFLQENGIKEIQLSLDTISENEINILVKRDQAYIDHIKNMLEACKELGLKVNTRTVLTKYNTTVSSLQDLYRFFSKYQVYSWTIVPATYSSYREGYESYQADITSLQQCKDYIDKLSENSTINISFNKLKDSESLNIKYQTVNDFLTYNKGCIVTSHNLTINVYGQVTLCELFYNKSKYHLGNAKKQSIHELWNSDLVKDFFNFHIHSIPKNTESPCYKCDSYAQCKVGNSKKVCLVDIVNAYGEDKWDYPDPRCPYAPKCDMNLLTK